MDKVFKTLGATNHSTQERETNDFYATDPIAIDLLEKSFNIPQFIWEPACGTGNLSTRLIQHGHNVFSSDIENRGYGQQIDFLNTNFIPDIAKNNNFAILTNPPFKYTIQFVEKALSILKKNQYLILFLKTLALESRTRYERIYHHTPPKLILQCIDRVLCAKNNNFQDSRKKLGNGAQAYAWLIWQKDNYKATQLTWI